MFSPKIKSSHEVRHRDTFNPAVLSQPAGDGPASPNGKAVACHKLLNDITHAKGLRQPSKKREQSLVFSSDIASDLRHVTKSGDVIDDLGMGICGGIQCDFVIEPVGRPVSRPLVLARCNRAGQILVKCEGVASVLGNS